MSVGSGCPPSSGRYPSFVTERRVGGSDAVSLSSEPYRLREQHLDVVASLPFAVCRSIWIDGEMVSWYGSRAIEGLRYLARLRRALAEERGAIAAANGPPRLVQQAAGTPGAAGTGQPSVAPAPAMPRSSKHHAVVAVVAIRPHGKFRCRPG